MRSLTLRPLGDVEMSELNKLSKKMIIIINFNNIKYSDDRLTSTWIDYRLNIFWKYTLQSFKAQTNQDFQVYLNYDIKSEAIIQDALKKREELPKNIFFRDTKSNKRAIENQIANSDLFYWIRLDSDNLFHKEYIQKLHDYAPKAETEAIVSQYGYLFGVQSDRLSYYYHFSPPFYALIYKSKEFIMGKRYELLGGHGSVAKDLKCEFLQGNNYLVCIHGQNVSYREQLIHEKNFVQDKEKKKIFQEFGISI